MAHGTYQHGKNVSRDEEEADRFASAIALPLSFANTVNINDKKALIRLFGLPEKKTEDRMVELRMHLIDKTEQTKTDINEIENFDAETWVKRRMIGNKFTDRSVPTEDEDWDF